MKARNFYVFRDLYFAGWAAYLGYEWYSYSGLYRLFAEWQLSTFSEYQEKGTFVVLLGVVAILPAFVLTKLLGLAWKSTAPPSPRVLLVIGMVLLAVAAGAGWYGYGKVTTDVAFEAFDLSAGKAPPSDHVTITGVAHTEYKVEFKREWSHALYIPITATDWRPGDPLVYFMTANTTVYTPPEGGRTFDLSQGTPVPLTTQPGVLIEGDLPGPVAELYRKNDVALAPVPVVLEGPVAATMPYFVAAGLCGLGGMCCLVAAAMVFRRQRQPQA